MSSDPTESTTHPDPGPVTPPDEAGRPARSPGVWDALVSSDLSLKTLLLDLPEFLRKFGQILKRPVGFFRETDFTGPERLKPGLAFLLQGLLLAFILFTMGWAIPRSIASYSATNFPLFFGTRDELLRYGQRFQALRGILPVERVEDWRAQGELMLALRVLPDERFALMLRRLQAVTTQDPELLELAINGDLTHGERFGGRNFMLTFFTALDPQRGPLLSQTYQLVYTGPRYELQAHIDFLLRSALLWYLGCFFAARVLPKQVRTQDGLAVYTAGATLAGFLVPVYQFFETLVRFYLAFTLPAYIRQASLLLVDPTQTNLALFSGGIFPFENASLAIFRIAVPVLLLLLAIRASTAGLQRAYPLSRRRALAAGLIGLAASLGISDLVMAILVAVLGPTGLL